MRTIEETPLPNKLMQSVRRKEEKLKTTKLRVVAGEVKVDYSYQPPLGKQRTMGGDGGWERGD
jgi:hypothetical protein